MKSFLFLFCFLLSFRLFAQAEETIPQNYSSTAVAAFSNYAYVNGKWLDSLAANYASFGFFGGDGITFGL